MTEHETYVQALRALRRLRSKSLLHGESWMNGKVCAFGALGAHLASKQARDFIEAPAPEYLQHTPATCELHSANDDFKPHNDSPEVQKARYQHMVRWLEQRIAETAP